MYKRKCESLHHIFVKENTQDNWFIIYMTSKLYTYACSCPAVFPSIHFRIHSNVDLHNQACIGTDQYPEGKTRTLDNTPTHTSNLTLATTQQVVSKGSWRKRKINTLNKNVIIDSESVFPREKPD